MGWAIRRQDGTYRAWNANAQDDALQPGEAWEPRETCPEDIGPSLEERALEAKRTATIDAALNDPTIPQAMKDALAALRGGA